MRRSALHQVLRWSARALSIASTVVLLLFLFGEPFTVSRITWQEWFGLALFPLGTVIGFVLGWRREILGGLITFGSLLVFCLLFVGDVRKGLPFFVFALPGFLFLISGLIGGARRFSSVHTSSSKQA